MIDIRATRDKKHNRPKHHKGRGEFKPLGLIAAEGIERSQLTNAEKMQIEAAHKVKKTT